MPNNAGDYQGAATEFGRWNKGEHRGVKQELPGLTRRRKAERDLFLSQQSTVRNQELGVGSQQSAVSGQRSANAVLSISPQAPTSPQLATTMPSFTSPAGGNAVSAASSQAEDLQLCVSSTG